MWFTLRVSTFVRSPPHACDSRCSLTHTHHAGGSANGGCCCCWIMSRRTPASPRNEREKRLATSERSGTAINGRTTLPKRPGERRVQPKGSEGMRTALGNEVSAGSDLRSWHCSRHSARVNVLAARSGALTPLEGLMAASDMRVGFDRAPHIMINDRRPAIRDVCTAASQRFPRVSTHLTSSEHKPILF